MFFKFSSSRLYSFSNWFKLFSEEWTDEISESLLFIVLFSFSFFISVMAWVKKFFNSKMLLFWEFVCCCWLLFKLMLFVFERWLNFCWLNMCWNLGLEDMDCIDWNSLDVKKDLKENLEEEDYLIGYLDFDCLYFEESYLVGLWVCFDYYWWG